GRAMNEEQFERLSEQVQTSYEMSRQTQVMMVQFLDSTSRMNTFESPDLKNAPARSSAGA
ncbi:MAG: hypothetical protein ACYCYO_07375, partial [Bacilli bacterium]